MITNLAIQANRDRGVAAALKNAAAFPHRAYDILAPFVDLTNDRQLAVALVLAPAIVNNRQVDDAGNIGKALARIRANRENWADMAMRRLMGGTTHASRCSQVATILRMAASDNISMDLDQLGRDLFYFNERTARRWAATYWGSGGDE